MDLKACYGKLQQADDARNSIYEDAFSGGARSRDQKHSRYGIGTKPSVGSILTIASYSKYRFQ
jgi:hypothetical protein